MHIEAKRAILRQTIGITGVFSIGLIIGWPLSVIGAVFTALFLQAPVGMTVGASARLFAFSIGLMLVSWLLSAALLPYPVAFLGMVCLGIILSFAWAVSGAGLLPGVLALMAALMIPNLTVQSPDLTLVLVFWVPVNLLIAGFTSGLMFTIIPAQPPAQAAAKGAANTAFDPTRRIVRMSLVTVPFAMIFFVSGAAAVLSLFFVALLSQQLAAAPHAGKTVAKAMLLSNGLGALVSIICYELTVIAPHLLTPLFLCATVCLMLGSLAKSEHALAAAAGSALTTFLVVYGGSIAPFSDEADVKAITRVIQIAVAAGFVIVAYVVVDEFWPEKEAGEERQRA